MDGRNKLGMKALYYIALLRDVETGGDKEHDPNAPNDPQQIQWMRSNQNRLNQNFSIISGELESIAERLSALENK